MAKKKNRKKQINNFNVIFSKDSEILRKLKLILDERKRNKKATIFINNLRCDNSRYRLQKRKYFFSNKTLRDIALCDMDCRSGQMILDYGVSLIDLEDSLDWAADIICSYSDEINEHIQIKERFESKYLLGKLEEANEILNISKSKFGMNLWNIQAELLIFRTDKNNQIFNDYLEINPAKNENSETFISNIISQINPSITASRYKFSIESNMEEMRNLGIRDNYKIAEFFNLYNPKINIEKPEIYFSQFQMLPLVDYYNSCIRLIRHLSKTDNKKRTEPFLKKIASKINDKNINFISYKNEFTKPKYITSINLTYLDACRLYTQAKYGECSLILKKIILEDPTNLVMLELLSKCSTRVDPDFTFNGVVGEFFDYLKKFNSGNYDRLDLERFEKLAISHSYNDWSFLLVGLLKKYGEGKDDEDINYLYEFSENISTYLNPFSSDFDRLCCIESKPIYDEKWTKYWRESSKKIINGDSCFNEYKDLEIDHNRLLKTIADTHFSHLNYSSALSVYSSISDVDKQIHDHCLLRSIRCLCDTGDHENLLEMSANKLLTNDGRHRLPLEYIIEKCAKSLKSLSQNGVINLAIIYHFYNQRNSDFLQKLSLCCYHYFKLNGIDIKYDFNDLKYDEKLIFFVGEILNEDVLDGLPRFFNGQNEILEFRIKILRSLINHVGDDEKRLLNLFSKLTSTSKVYLGELVRGEIGSGRVTIDKEKLVSLISTEIKNDYKELKNALKDIEKVEENHIKENEEKNDYFYIVDENLRSLFLLFLHIRDEYAINKSYGLDNYLNLNIRHGGMVNHLWKSIKENNLACEKNSTGEYENNKFWEEHYPFRTKESVKNIHETLITFTKTMDSLINEAKGWVHVNTGEFPDEKKIFNFVFDFDSLDLSLNYLRESSSVEEFIVSIFKLLDEMLDSSLAEAHKRLNTDFRNKTHNCFDKLATSLKGSDTHLHRIASKTKGELNTSIDELILWFDYKGLGRRPLPLSVLVETVYKNVASYFPEKTSNIDITSSAGRCLIRGELIHNFFDIFNLLITNAFEHSGCKDNLLIIVKVEISKNVISFLISNNINEEYLENIKNEILQINMKKLPEFEKHAYKDKGSGVCKVKKILNKDIGLSSEVFVALEKEIFNINFDCDQSVVAEFNG